jgi:hypothetical protein
MLVKSNVNPKIAHVQQGNLANIITWVLVRSVRDETLRRSMFIHIYHRFMSFAGPLMFPRWTCTSPRPESRNQALDETGKCTLKSRAIYSK